MCRVNLKKMNHFGIILVLEGHPFRWFSPGPPVSSTNKTDRHDIAEILLKVALNTIKQKIFIIFPRLL
jgi:hypothetical protein